ncbi:hypothetical protein sos41_22790 [Alphaproteobacteria bacterium SO-S41]|nr:hypothetical protein sos41_22790 [Alphaproteobacteria bacterium SO-S41]
MISDTMKQGIVALRPFVPARDLAQSRDFYERLGFTAEPLGDQLFNMRLGDAEGAFAFLLQDYYVKDWAENFMMHLLVRDLDAWWAHVESLQLETHFPVQAPRAPAMQPWGLRIFYVFDPAGVLWHIAGVPG